MRPPYDALLDEEIRAYVAEVEAFSAGNSPEPVIAEIRASYDAMAEAFRVPRPEGLQVSDGTVGRVPVRVYGHGPVTVLFIHGGGFALGGLDSHDDVCAEIADRCALRVVALAYRLAPEHPHPAQLEDCAAVLDWVKERFGPSVILAGDSAGGTLAAVLAHHNRRRGLLGQVLIYPSLGGPRAGGSHVDHAEAPMLTSADMALFSGYLAAPEGEMTPLTAPDFLGLPPTLALSAACDPLADDARLYVERLTSAGISAQWHPGEGLVHSYLRARHRSEKAGAAFEAIITAISTFAQGERH